MKPYQLGNGIVINLDQVCEFKKDKREIKQGEYSPIILFRYNELESIQPFVSEELRDEVFNEIVDICRNIKNQ